MKLLMALIASFLLFSSCTRLETPADLEREILSNTTYDSQFLDCRERAHIATRWLREHGYTFSICGEQDNNVKHVFVRWYKEGESGDILRLPGQEVWCTKQGRRLILTNE